MSAVPKRILIGLSCSPESEAPEASLTEADLHTFDQGLWLAAKVGASIRLVHVVDFLDERISGEDHEVELLVRSHLAGAIEELRRKADAAGVTTDYAFANGRAWYELLREAHQSDSDLVMLSRRRSGLTFGDRIIHGSTASRIARKAQSNVWLSAPGAPTEIKKVLALVDGRSVSKTIVECADALCQELGAERHVLRCLDYPEDVALHRLPNAQRAITAHHKAVRADTLVALQKLTGGEDAGWSLSLSDDWVVRVAPKYVAQHDIDLVVLGGLSYPRLKGVLLGTTAERILERTPIATWLIRPDGWQSPVEFEES
jgi:nucleotide-binding universal stress UspA family protein